jgi:hypothetical protein
MGANKTGYNSSAKENTTPANQGYNWGAAAGSSVALAAMLCCGSAGSVCAECEQNRGSDGDAAHSHLETLLD